MKDSLLEIINYNGVIPQLKHFNSEVFELNEAIIKKEEAKYNYYENYTWTEQDELKEHIMEEIADCIVMLNQFINYYDINYNELEKQIEFKVNRTLEKVKNGEKI